MEMSKFKGVFPALLTPFDSNNKINAKELEKLIKFNMDKGASGFYCGGSTSEAFLLSLDERKYLYDIAKDTTNGKCTLIAHVGCISTDESIELAKYAEKLNFDAVSSVAPFYFKFTFDEIKDHYFNIVNAVNAPMIIYNFPAFSGVNLTTANISEFLQDDRFIGLKHTSNDYFALERFKSKFPSKVMYNGFDEMFLCGLAMGADGGIGSTYNLMIEKFVAIYKLFNENKIDEARKIQNCANNVIESLCKYGVFQSEKEVLNMLGFDFGICRKPFKPLSSEDAKALRAAVAPELSKLY